MTATNFAATVTNFVTADGTVRQSAAPARSAEPEPAAARRTLRGPGATCVAAAETLHAADGNAQP